jgi:phosphate transport system substrate-binding protein
VHPNNPLRALDRAALHDIFTGRIVDWKDVGGPAGPIRVLSRDARSGTFDTFKHLVLDKDALASSAALYPENEALADAVASDAAAIGFVGLAYVRTAKALAVGEPGTEPMLPTHFTVATEGYMLSRRLYLYTLPAPRTPWVTEFVSYALSRKAQELAGRSQFVDLGLMMRTAPCVGHCPARYAAAIANAQRISLDFRFRSGSDEPDSRAGRDLERLVNYLSDQSDLKLLLLGFSDVVGNVQANQRLSLERAKAIEHELTMRGVRPSVVSGFGSEMPLASNDSEAGRQKNRRVEVWVQR